MNTKLTKYLALTVVALFLIVGGASLIKDLLEWISPKPTYSCSGGGTAKLLKEAIESGPLSTILNIGVYQVDNNHELSHEDNKLLCIADILLNSGHKSINSRVTSSPPFCSAHSCWLPPLDGAESGLDLS